MQLNVKEFLNQADVKEQIYPGKRIIHACRQTGEYKSHCVVVDWRDPEKIRIEVKAGLSGKTLDVKQLKYYPVSFQMPTYVDIKVINDNKDDEKEDEDEKSKSGKGGSGGKKPAKRKTMDEMTSVALKAFSAVTEGNIPEIGKIVEMVVLGTKIAKESFGNVMGKFAEQIKNTKIATTELLANAGNFVTKYKPPSFMEPTGNETADYKYDREKNADIGYRRPSVG